MNITSFPGPATLNLGGASKSFTVEYEETVQRIRSSQCILAIDLQNELQKAEQIMAIFKKSQNAQEAQSSLHVLALDVAKTIALRKIELMCREIREMAEKSEKLELNLHKTAEVANFILTDSKDCIPQLSQSELYVYEQSAKRRLAIAKSEIYKRTTLRRMENLILEYQSRIDLDLAEGLFYKYTEKLHLNDSKQILSPVERDELLEEFRERLEFLSPEIKFARSEINKEAGLKRLENLMLEFKGKVDPEQAQQLFHNHVAKLHLKDANRHLNPDERDAIAAEFRDKLMFLNPDEARIMSEKNKRDALKRMKEILLSNPLLAQKEEAIRLIKEYVGKVHMEEESRLMTAAETTELVTECLKALERLKQSN